MIPVKLRLRNFMCYRDPAPLDFSGIRLACLAGDNGHGKSALLDAMTWALWGKARARYDDELVSSGQQEMEVEFEFQLGNAHFRVLRKRELARRSRGSLDLQIKDNGRFRSLTGSTQRETQSRIDNFLHMDYDTFINSALLLQGRADEFTVKPPTERKRILADILGLSIYDEYEQRAKDVAKEKEQAQREVQVRIHEIDRELEHRPDHERELQQAQAQLACLAGQARAAEKALHEVRDQMRMLEAQRAQLVDILSRIQAGEAQVRNLDQQIEAQAARLSTYESVLQRRENIEAGYARLLQAREQEAQCSGRLSAMMALVEQRANLETAIAEARKGLEVQRDVITDRMLEAKKLADQLPARQAEHTRVAAEVQELLLLRDQARAGQQSIGHLSEEASALKALNTQLKKHMAALNENLTLLQQPTAVCPLCGQGLAENDRQSLLVQLEEEVSEQTDRYRRNAEQRDDINAQVASIRSEVEGIELELRRLPALQGREATLQEAVRQAQEATANLSERQHLLDSLQEQLERAAFAEQEQRQLAELDARISALGYDKAAHESMRQTLSNLAAFEMDKAQLDGALQAINEVRSNLQQMHKTRLDWATTLEADRQRHAELSTALERLSGLSRDLSVKQREVDELRGKEGHARQVVGAAQQKLDHCSYLAGERKDRAAQLRMLNEERSLYEELRMAFGKRGVQALIIENVLPELEDEANELLRRMTDGRMSVHFETQHETKSGTTVETLDIKISDESGPRNYEMYSGGEAFRINFAIRIALSKLLARRAGAQLQTLIMDEGFGTQDAEGRQRLVEAINSIRDDFALIIVITHIEELKDAFPVRIDVHKTPAGSEIMII